MFDDPKKKLQELEGQLLAAEMDEQEFDTFFDDIRGEFGSAEPDSAAEPNIRNFANGYGRAVSGTPEVPVYSYDNVPAPSDGGIRALTILASVECLAIAAVAVYWFFHFL